MGSRFVKKDTLDELVTSLCKDYARRERSLNMRTLSHRTRVELKYINYKIAEAAREVVGDDFATYINEIGESVGYAKSDIDGVSEKSYKTKKAEVKLNIARKLHLAD